MIHGLQASHNAEEKLNAGDDVRGESRDAFAVIMLDTQQRVPEVRHPTHGRRHCKHDGFLLYHQQHWLCMNAFSCRGLRRCDFAVVAAAERILTATCGAFSSGHSPLLQVAQQLKQALSARSAASGSNIGIGLVAMNSFEDVSAWLKVRLQVQLWHCSPQCYGHCRILPQFAVCLPEDYRLVCRGGALVSDTPFVPTKRPA